MQKPHDNNIVPRALDFMNSKLQYTKMLLCTFLRKAPNQKYLQIWFRDLINFLFTDLMGPKTQKSNKAAIFGP